MGNISMSIPRLCDHPLNLNRLLTPPTTERTRMLMRLDNRQQMRRAILGIP
jgi:hypothetical protein